MLILDFLLLIAISVCIGYSWTLNRRIQDLQNSRIEFARMIKELNSSILKAEMSVGELKELGKNTSNELKVSIESARTAASELMVMNNISSDLAGVLNEKIIGIRQDIKVDKLRDTAIRGIEIHGESQNNKFFTDEDIIDDTNDTRLSDYKKSSINGLIHNNSKATEHVNLNQAGYYNTLKKINLKR